MKLVDLLDKVIEKGVLSSCSLKPGAIIQKLPKEVREKLKELKSEDIKDVRIK